MEAGGGRRSLGFGIVTFPSQNQLERALADMNGFEVKVHRRTLYLACRSLYLTDRCPCAQVEDNGTDRQLGTVNQYFSVLLPCPAVRVTVRVCCAGALSHDSRRN